jgi:hypothetical protein
MFLRANTSAVIGMPDGTEQTIRAGQAYATANPIHAALIERWPGYFDKSDEVETGKPRGRK